MLTITADKIIHAAPMQVWELLSDHEHLSTWMSFDRVVRIRPGFHEPNGVGAVRELHRGSRVMQERITRFEPGRRLDYDVLKGAPGYAPKGQIILTPTRDGGTLVWWKVTLHPYVPASGGLIRRILSRSLGAALEQLRQRLESEPLLALAGDRAPTAHKTAASTRTKRRAAGRAKAAEEAAGSSP